MFGGIEAGGTKFVCGVGTGPEDLITVEFPTTTPEATVREATRFFHQSGDKLEAVGIASFGPVDPRPSSPGFGHITSTPKPGWQNFDLGGAVRSALRVPIGFDTDVNGAALGEARWGAARGLTDFIYLTIGTGIGGGAMVNGLLIHGMLHPEMGHVRVPHDRTADPFPGTCPFHKDCLEGLASGPAIEARWGKPARALPTTHPAWQLEAHYLALGLAAWVCTLSPQRILIGGGVMEQAHLFPLARAELTRLLGGYIQTWELINGIDEYIVPPQLGRRAGVLGAIALAERARSDVWQPVVAEEG